MGEPEDIEKVVHALEKVPPKQLKIIELANSIPITGGSLDMHALMEKVPEINLATAEATAYGTVTIQAVDALARLLGKTDED
jgi:hypothetical protein